MKRLIHSINLICWLGLAILLATSCDRIKDTRPIPPDTDPGIALEAPTNSNFLRTIGSTVDLTFRLVDNEALKVFRVTESIFNEVGDTLILDNYLADILVDGEVVLQNYSYPVAPIASGISIRDYYKIMLTFYVIDTKGASNYTTALINVIPNPAGPPRFLLNSYTGKRLIHPNSFTNEHRYNFTSVTHPKPVSPPNLTLDSLGYDVEIVNSLPGPLDGKSLLSPSNIFYNRDSVFVLTNASRFNYDEATYQTIREAFYSDPDPASQIPMPSAGDYVIIRLIKDLSVAEHFAILRVTDLNLGSNPPYLEFDYKVSY